MTDPISSPDLSLKQAQASIQQALNWFASRRRHWNYPPNPDLQAAVRPDLQAIKAALEKVEQRLFKIAAFGLVSRGKSAVLNALIGQNLLPTGPLHGVTQWPQSLRWQTSEKIQIDLIDTPGLDEIAGEGRSEMAQTVAQQADLILFIVAGDITRTEYQALCDLCQNRKPLLLVFNKIDLYPDQDQQAIYQQLQNLAQQAGQAAILRPEDIVCVAADPPPQRLRLEFSDRPDEERWEKPASQIDSLRQKILFLLNQRGPALLALNALLQTEAAEQRIAQKTLKIREVEANALIWRYAQYKALVVAANPVAVLDVLGGLVADLFLIRALARLYGLPITSFEAGKLWQKILLSSGGLLLGELGGSVMLSFNKTASLLENPGSFSTYAGTAFVQAGLAGYGTYLVGQATKIYLAQGCSWGPWGASTVIRSLIDQITQLGPENKEGFSQDGPKKNLQDA
ncbi:GTP-binding protein [Synechocystis sp. LKSZ1]|uniref:GTP-binding protein n=1 Tax=Synechocystis sp. LKSZ1 TaxID=3144951 RepID=UPI00336BD0E9